MTGKKIHNYKITAEIGKGGMATVYKAKHIELNTTVAVKILNPALVAEENIKQRFKQEAQIMATLKHPGITQVYDFVETGNQLAIVMEYLQGETLNDFIKQRGKLGNTQTKQIFNQILDAFNYAHSKNIIHRDIKPSNIFITRSGKVKIMDFGIAKIIEDGTGTLTQTGTQMGTPVYMSPEQVNDSKNIDRLSDIYSLGVVLWFMLAGKPPYDDKTNSRFAIFKKIDTEALPELGYELFDKIIQKATAKEKDYRFNNCQSFKDALNNRMPLDDETIIYTNNHKKPSYTPPDDLIPRIPIQEVEKFINSKSNYFPDELIPILKDELKNLSREKFNRIINFEYKNPKAMFWAACPGGIFGLDRFLLGEIGLGITKIFLGLYTLGIWYIADCFTVSGRTKRYNYDKFLELKTGIHT